MVMIAKTSLKKTHIYLMQIFFAFFVFFAYHNFTFEKTSFSLDDIPKIAHFILYLLIMKGSEELIHLIHNAAKAGCVTDIKKVVEKYQKSLLLFIGSVALLLYLNETVLRGDFLLFTIATLAIKYPEIGEKTSQISYGTGMACSFVEGYLVNVIPPDGGEQEGFQGNITNFESNNDVVFPVKRLFLIVPKGLHCPTDLKEFNRENKLPYLEACNSLPDVQKDVAGVKRRVYRNSAYKIRRSAPAAPGPAAPGSAAPAAPAPAAPAPAAPAPARPVYLAAECATPLHTLYKVKQHNALYDELIEADYAEIRDDFCAMLQAILDTSPDFRNKCELVHYDHEDDSQNLSEILLKRIEELEPNFENIIAKR